MFPSFLDTMFFFLQALGVGECIKIHFNLLQARSNIPAPSLVTNWRHSKKDGLKLTTTPGFQVWLCMVPERQTTNR